MIHYKFILGSTYCHTKDQKQLNESTHPWGLQKYVITSLVDGLLLLFF